MLRSPRKPHLARRVPDCSNSVDGRAPANAKLDFAPFWPPRTGPWIRSEERPPDQPTPNRLIASALNLRPRPGAVGIASGGAPSRRGAEQRRGSAFIIEEDGLPPCVPRFRRAGFSRCPLRGLLRMTFSSTTSTIYRHTEERFGEAGARLEARAMAMHRIFWPAS
jgi:hypothetical protein